MQIPTPVEEWLLNKVDQRWASVRQARSETVSFVKHLGPRSMQATVSGSIVASTDFALTVDAFNQDAEYVTGAKDGVFTVLISQSYMPILACEIHLHSFVSHEIDSSYAAFYRAARELTERLLGIAEGYEHNIQW